MEQQIRSPAVAAAVENLIQSIQIELNPTSSPQHRLEAHKFCERFRREESTSMVAVVGIVLTTKSEVEIVFSGLRLLEDVVKYKWAYLDSRELVKQRLLHMLAGGFCGLSVQPSFLKEALARTVVEIAKREWPQLWTNFIPYLFEVGKTSSLAYNVMRRLFEDISLCQNDENSPRKRDLLQSLVVIAKSTVPALFKLLCEALENHSAVPSASSLANCKLFLGCILPFIELANVDLFLEEHRLTLLFQLLRHPDLNIQAAECILQMFQRKPDKREKVKIYSECIKDVNFLLYAETLTQVGDDDPHFLKQLCDILGYIGSNCEKDPASISKFLGATETLASKTTITSVMGASIALNSFLRSTTDVKDRECLKQMQYTQQLNVIVNLMIKKLVSNPVRDEKDEMSRLKGEFCMILRSMSKLWPSLYLFISPWIMEALDNADKMEVCQWESLASIIDTVSSIVSPEEEEVILLGLHHLNLCFEKYSTQENLALKSAMLSTVSGLFIFLSLAKKKIAFTSQTTNLMCSIIKSMFQCFLYPDSERVIRRHVASLFIKLAKDNGELFIDMFESIRSETEALKGRLNTMEYTSLIEALLVTSNRWDDKSLQLNFIATLIVPTEWQDMASLCHSVNEFATIFSEPVFYEKRPIFLRNLNVLLAIFNRVQFPTDSPSVFAEAVFNCIRPTFPVVLELTKTIHSLLLDPSMRFLHEMTQSEKNTALGCVDYHQSSDDSNGGEKSVKEKMKVFVRTIEDCAYGILGGCGSKFGTKLYSSPNIADAYLNYIGSVSPQMEDFQIRRFLRMVYKPFLLSCPLEYAESVIIPFVQQFGPFVMNRLVSRWEAVNFESMDDENAPSEEAEIIENAYLRVLTKDYFDLIAKLLELSNTSSEDLNKSFYVGCGMDMDDDGVQNGQSRAHHGTSNQNELGEIGKLLLNDQICFQAIVHLCATALCWKFSQVSLKAARCILLSMKHIGNHPQVVRGVFTMALRAVIIQTENEPNFDAIFRIIDQIMLEFYETDPTILQSIKNLGATADVVTQIITLILVNSPANVKKRKEILRHLIRQHPSTTENQAPKSQWLSQLPKLLINDPDKIAKQESSSKDVNLRECFSLIHIS